MSSDVEPDAVPPASVSVVIPVYQGAATLEALIEEIRPLREPTTTPGGLLYRIEEVILVWDHGPDSSDEVIERLATANQWVVPIWLARNFGQHPATVAGMSSSKGDWVVTLDEDGQHRPSDIGLLLDTAERTGADLVYATPTNPPPHSFFRNLASRLTKGVVLRALTGPTAVPFHSFRLISGEHARAVAAFCGPGVYLDVALRWVIGVTSGCPLAMRSEGREATGYNVRRLVSHFWRLVLSSGNRPLRIVSGLGVLTSVLGLLYSIVLVIERLRGSTEVQGWTSAIVATLVVGGLVLVCLGVIAE
ncbi:MAG: glycosyltransferase, partial [Cellulomonadaceae bacterium]|nr:glycosyltransferase [Cellulomonadaceae bacterium]